MSWQTKREVKECVKIVREIISFTEVIGVQTFADVR